MKKIILRLASLLTLAAFIGVAPLAAQAWKQIPIPPLPAFHPQEPKRIELPNGMVIFLQEDHELPLIDGVARIRGGSRSEPADKIGLVDLYGEVWRTGGTKDQTGDQLDDYLEIRAAKVETEGGADSTTISLSCLKDDFNDVFKVFADLLQNPAFREDKLDLAKKEAFDAISRRNDEISDIARREGAMLAYGKDNPYARIPEYATISAVTREDLVKWHDTYVHPNDIILGLVGDFDSAQMEAKIRAAFGGWERADVPKPPEIEFNPAKPGYYLIKKEDVDQSNIRMVGLGTTRRNPDFYAIEVLNEAFGGGFSARLIQSIRTAQGLAYAVGGGIGARFDHPGILQLVMGTKSSSTIQAIKALDQQIDELKTRPIDEQEMKRAKDAILNAFVFNFDTPDKVLRERMAYEFYGYPADFLEQYRAGIEKVTTADVARVVEKYIHKDQLAVLVVGNAPNFDQPLSSLGPVTDIDVAIPAPAGEKGESQSSEKKESNPEGLALATKVADSLGGEAKLKTVKATKSAFAVTQIGGPMAGTVQLDSTVVYPDHLKAVVHATQGDLAIVVTPDSGFMSAEGMGVRDMPESQKNESMEQIRRDPVYLAQHADDPAFTFTAEGTEKSGGMDTTIVDVSGPGVSLRWFVDPQTGKIVRETYKTLSRSGPVDGETDFSDWKTVDGLNIPFHRDNKQNGENSSSVQYTSIELNPTVDPKIFDKPAAPAQ